MNLLDISFPWAHVSACLFTAIGAGLLGVWALRPAHRYLLWQAVGMWLLAVSCAGVMHVWIWWCAAWVGAQAMSMRYGHTVKPLTVFISSVFMLAATGICLRLEWSAQVYGWVVALALGLVLLHGLAGVLRGAIRHRADQWLRCIYVGCAVYVVLHPLIDDVAMQVVAGWMAAFLWSTNLAICAWHDSRGQPRAADCRDRVTRLFNRAGLEAINKVALLEQGITIVMLCELKPSRHSGRTVASKSALQAFAKLLQTSVREGDWVARTGSEEFVMALRDLECAQAHALVARMQAALLEWRALNGYVASFGLAQVQAGDFLDMAIHRADVMRHQTKEDGLPTTLPSSAPDG